MALRQVAHFVLATLFLFGVLHDAYVVKYPEPSDTWFERWQYLPVWNLYLQAQFFALALLIDVVASCGLERRALDAVSDVSFASIIFPLAVMVCVSFSMSNDPLLFNPMIPRWLSILIHLMALPAVLLEMMLVDHHYGRHRWWNYSILVLITIVNLSWVVYVGQVYNFFASATMQKLTPMQQVCAVAISALCALVPYKWGEVMYNYLWTRAQ